MTKEERKEYNRNWNANNKLKRKEYYEKNKDKILNKNKLWNKQNKKNVNAIMKKHFLKLNLTNKDISRRTLNAWSVQIKKRDTACLYCNSKENLQAHHILSKSKHPEFALFLNNGITLCKMCHLEEHRINGEI